MTLSCEKFFSMPKKVFSIHFKIILSGQRDGAYVSGSCLPRGKEEILDLAFAMDKTQK